MNRKKLALVLDAMGSATNHNTLVSRCPFKDFGAMTERKPATVTCFILKVSDTHNTSTIYLPENLCRKCFG